MSGCIDLTGDDSDSFAEFKSDRVEPRRAPTLLPRKSYAKRKAAADSKRASKSSKVPQVVRRPRFADVDPDEFGANGISESEKRAADAAEATSNAKAKAGGKSSRTSRYWCFTAFPHDLSDDSESEEESSGMDPCEIWWGARFELFNNGALIRYVVTGRETCPDTDKIHIQGYVEFAQTKSQTMGSVKKLFDDDTIHLEQRRGTRQEARDYCLKDGDFIEHGKWLAGAGARSDIYDLAEAVLEGKDDEWIGNEMGYSFIKHSKGIAALRAAVDRPKVRKIESISVMWGEPGGGKSTAAVKWAEAEEAKGNKVFWRSHAKEWFDGYQGEPIVIFDDYNDNLPMTTLLKLLGPIPLPLEIKGAYTPCKATKFLFTSNTHPKEWYKDDGYNKQQLLWRMTKPGCEIIKVRAKDKSNGAMAVNVWPPDLIMEVDHETGAIEMVDE